VGFAGVALIVLGAGLLVFALAGRAGRNDARPGVPQATATSALRGGLADFSEVGVTVTDVAGRSRSWCLLAARTAEQHQRGLMEVRDRSLAGHGGMLFLFDADQEIGFWMRNTPMPLSIAYLDRRGKVASVTDMAPCADRATCPTYPAGVPYRSAVEVPRGRLGRLGLERRATLRVTGPCAAS